MQGKFQESSALYPSIIDNAFINLSTSPITVHSTNPEIAPLQLRHGLLVQTKNYSINSTYKTYEKTLQIQYIEKMSYTVSKFHQITNLSDHFSCITSSPLWWSCRINYFKDLLVQPLHLSMEHHKWIIIINASPHSEACLCSALRWSEELIQEPAMVRIRAQVRYLPVAEIEIAWRSTKTKLGWFGVAFWILEKNA